MQRIPRWLIDSVKISLLLDLLLFIYNLVIKTPNWIIFIPQCLLSFIFLLIYNYIKMKYNQKKIAKKKSKNKLNKEKINQQKQLEHQIKRKQNNQNKQIK